MPVPSTARTTFVPVVSALLRSTDNRAEHHPEAVLAPGTHG